MDDQTEAPPIVIRGLRPDEHEEFRRASDMEGRTMSAQGRVLVRHFLAARAELERA